MLNYTLMDFVNSLEEKSLDVLSLAIKNQKGTLAVFRGKNKYALEDISCEGKPNCVNYNTNLVLSYCKTENFVGTLHVVRGPATRIESNYKDFLELCEKLSGKPIQSFRIGTVPGFATDSVEELACTGMLQDNKGSQVILKEWGDAKSITNALTRLDYPLD